MSRLYHHSVIFCQSFLPIINLLLEIKVSKVKFNSEKDLEDYICEYMEKHGQCPVTGENVELWWRQVNFGGYGIADIIKAYFDPNGDIYLTVLELKNEKITSKCLAQTLRYRTCVKEFIGERFNKHEEKIHVYSEILGTRLSMQDDTCYLVNDLESLSVYSFEIDVDNGFSVESIGKGWSRTNPEFKDNKDIVNQIRKASIRTAIEYKRYLKSQKENSNIAVIK